jgi:hypothetical protein
MKLLLLGTLLVSGGGVAATNETVQEEVSNVYQQVKERVQQGFRGSMLERVKESGFPYPNEALLAQMTDEQEAIYMTTIDQINAEYDWANMTDEEIREALELIKVELTALRDEFGIEAIQTQSRRGKHWNDEFVPKGNNQGLQGQNPDYDGDCPLDDTDPSDEISS